jgi:DNA repair protein SbcC/Rad50
VLEQLTFTNFQCHKSRVIELDPFVTVLIGDNGSGKTAILRGLKFLALNEWDGTANEMISWGEESCEAALLVDGRTIRRVKSKDSNLYYLDDEEFKAFHPNVPEPVQNLLKMGPDNFQDQHDAAFWLHLNSSQAATALNEIFSLTQIDEALDAVAREVRQATTRVNVSKERLQAAREAKEKLVWVKEANVLLCSLEKIQQELEQLQEEERNLRKVLDSSRQIKQQQAAASAGERCLQIGAKIVALDNEIGVLDKILVQEQEQGKLQRVLADKQEKLAKSLQGTCPLCGSKALRQRL